ncbi:MAG: STY4526/YPO1902 family pathogenicity island replication protein [Pseudomonadota bacterium]
MTNTMDKDSDHDRSNREQDDSSSIKACLVIAQLNRAYLHAVIQAYEDHDIPLINALGLPLELAQRLAAAPVTVVERLGKFRTPVANFIGDAVVIDRLLTHNLSRIDALKNVDELLRLGGSFDFIASLTGLVYSEIALRANAMGLAQPGSRPRMLSDEEWQLAERAWHQQADQSLLDRWINVATSTGISIRRLHAAYRKYDYLPCRDDPDA